MYLSGNTTQGDGSISFRKRIISAHHVINSMGNGTSIEENIEQWHCRYVYIKQLRRVMRLTIIVLLLACLQVSAKGFAQTISLSESNTPLDKVFHKIEQQSGYIFWYNESILRSANLVNITVKDADLSRVLAILFRNQPFSYKIIEKIIAVKYKDSLSPLQEVPNLTNESSFIDIKGKVINETGDPIAGVTVTIKGTNKATYTNNLGEFQLNNTDKNAILIFSGTNVETFEFKVTGQIEVVVKLRPKINKLDEVQVIGYGTTTRRLNTGNVGSMKSEDIQKQPVSNPLAALEGRVPGVFITQSTGLPGGAFQIQIRGKNSIANGNDPFYIIDGVPYVSQLITGLNPGLGGNPLNFIDISDIESIDVLKDADATAIYGSRGANGVILITTKKGKQGKTRLDVNTYFGSGKVPLKVQWLNSQQYLQMRREAFSNDNVAPTTTRAPDLLVWDTTRYIDWQKYLIGGSSTYNNIGASLSGGNSNTQYILGGRFYRESTVFNMDAADKKFSINFNLINKSANNKFKITFTSNYLIDNSKLPPTDLTTFVAGTLPDAPAPLNADGTLNFANSTFSNNPVSIKFQKYKGQTNNLIANSLLNYSLLKGLELKCSFGYSLLQVNEIITTPIGSQDPAFLPTGSSFFTKNSINTWIIEPQVEYKKNLVFGQFNALIGSTLQQLNSDGQYLSGLGYTSDAQLESIQAAPTLKVSSLTNANYKYNALFGRLNYNYGNKYLIDFTIRRDGTSRFGTGNEFHNFGAIGGSWIFSKEQCIQQLPLRLSFGKIRLSYGVTGNDQIGDYKYYDLYNSTTYSYQNVPGLTPSSLYNPNLQWEETRKFEGGLELGFFDDKLEFSFSYYRNRSSNQLLSYSLSAVTGFTSILSNFPATVQNDGTEFMFGTTNIKLGNVLWTASASVTIPHNSLVAFPNLSNSSYKNNYIVGKPITLLQLYQFLGVDAQTGVYRFGNINGEPVSSTVTSDRITINTAPKYYGGIQNKISYGGFQLDLFVQFVKQVGFNYLYQVANAPGSRSNQPIAVMNRWQTPGQSSQIQKFTQDASSTASAQYSISGNNRYTDASFIRFKNVQISYQISKKLCQMIHLDNLRFFIQGQNILTITKYGGMDPETKSITSLPLLRTVVGGFNLSL